MSYYDKHATKETIKFLRDGGAGSVRHLTARELRSHVFHLDHTYIDDQGEWDEPQYATVDWHEVEETVGFSSPTEKPWWKFW